MQVFDKLLLHLSLIERERNGQIITGSQNERKFRYVRDCLCNFTQTVMKRDFNILTFDDIDTQFLQKYVNHLNGRNVKNKLQKLRRVFREANADTSVFDGVKIPVKLEGEPLSVDHTAIERIEFMSRSKLTDKEELYIDLFLFGYYTGGTTINEMASLKHPPLRKGTCIASGMHLKTLPSSLCAQKYYISSTNISRRALTTTCSQSLPINTTLPNNNSEGSSVSRS